MAQYFDIQCCVALDTAADVASLEPALTPTETTTGRKENQAQGELPDRAVPRTGVGQSAQSSPDAERPRTPQSRAAQSAPERCSRGSIASPRMMSDSTCTPHSEGPTSESSIRSERGRSWGGEITNATIEEAIKQVSTDIRQWNPDDFSLQRRIQDAPCNHGKVLLMHGKFGEQVAVKKMPNAWVRGGYENFKQTYTSSENPWHDMAILKLLSDMNFGYSVKFLGVYKDPQHTYVCSEFANQGDVFVWCNTTPLECGPMREKVVRPMIAQLLTGVMVLHDMGVAHRDISVENVLLADKPDGSTKVFLADFGMAVTSRECSGAKKFGKKQYRAPELSTPELVCDAFLVDHFALGVLIFCWIVSNYPWTATNDDCPLFRAFQKHGCTSFLRRRKTKTGRLLDNVSPEAIELLEGFLQFDPDKRSCVGEKCFAEELHKRSSAWDNTWLRDLAPRFGVVSDRHHLEEDHEFRVIV
eukprot:TRINITY_DN18190_c0_g1_i2.p1 TRINITY_DN18190_c0_g1~~TRINITY_DN18190_c0_g1_i2.p1  ORF type:complete len:471 (-),score=71.13 TRINITY_DN18190_c0_g1_i2:42-1454(-)